MSGRYILRKLLASLVTIVAIVILNFVLFRMMPGSPERASKNPHLTPELVAANRAKWGLDKPLFPDQLIAYIESTASGDLGYSIKYRGQPVTEVVARCRRPDRPPHRARRGRRDRRRPVDRGPVGLETRRHDRPGRQRPQPDLLLDAVLRDRHAPDHHLRGRTRLVPDLRDDHARWRQDPARGPVRPRAPPRPAADRRRPRADRRLLDPDALVDHRDALRGLHHHGPGEGPVGHPDPATSTRSRTRCCRW